MDDGGCNEKRWWRTMDAAMLCDIVLLRMLAMLNLENMQNLRKRKIHKYTRMLNDNLRT